MFHKLGYTHLTLAHSKDQDEGRTHFYRNHPQDMQSIAFRRLSSRMLPFLTHLQDVASTYELFRFCVFV